MPYDWMRNSATLGGGMNVPPAGVMPGIAPPARRAETPLATPLNFGTSTATTPETSMNMAESMIASDAARGSTGLNGEIASQWANAAKAPGTWDKFGSIMDGLGQVGRVWAAFQQNKIAKESLKFQKKAWEKNFANQLQSYNTALTDRATSRYAQMEDPGRAKTYIEDNRLRG